MENEGSNIMRGRKTYNRGLCLLVTLIIVLTSVIVPVPSETASAGSNIKVYNFIKLLVPAAGLEIDTTQANAYLKAAVNAGIVKEGDFTDYKAYITRMDAAVLLNRADEYLHGDTVDAKVLQTVLDKRISDIKKIPAAKRESVAKVYVKGFIVGKSNGMYIQNRSYNGAGLMAAGDAKKIIALLKNASGRAKMSPDGQLIRTTNLPKNAKDYPYILEAFPNSFYEMKFSYQRGTYSWEPVEGFDYARPVRVTETMSNIEIDENGMCIYVDDWIKKAEDNLKYRLNVDYRTIDNTWINNLRRTYFVANDASLDEEQTNYIKKYVNYVKKNKIVIKSSIISVEPSTLYANIRGYQVRVYIKFKIYFPGDKKKQNDLFFGNTRFIDLTWDKWFEGVYDIGISTRDIGSNGSDYSVGDDTLNDYYYKGK